MIRMDRYSIEEAKKSLEICDHMNVDIEWLICRIENLQKENAILREALELAVKSGEFFSRHADCRKDSWSCRCEFCKDNSASKNLREAREALEKVKSEI